MDEAPSLNRVTLELYEDWPWTLRCRTCGMACGPVTTVHRFGCELAPPEPGEA